MPQDPLLTRGTLLLRLRDPADDNSWAEFAEIYTPLLYGYCLKRGLRHSDIADVVQEVMKSVARAIRGFDYDPERGSFRGWLFTAVRHELGRYFKRLARSPLNASETRLAAALEQAPDEREERDWELDYRKEMLRWAMDKVRPEISDRIWSAFELTAIRDRSPADVAAELDMTRGAVHLAKHRVLARIRETIQSVAAERWEIEVSKNSSNS